MAKGTGTLWPITPHTQAKHIILQKYLGAWIPIISKYNGKVIYVDGFSGPGEYRDGELGSPLIAIKFLSRNPHHLWLGMNA
ncbi:MAG TPA: three-Cys-motif partner protein TcmP [Candidatus Nanoarchaeia archaeon]|nr:three-Cys-motif partner protein TcmP [Candidatus Nanoarchaeia archaeon]